MAAVERFFEDDFFRELRKRAKRRRRKVHASKLLGELGFSPAPSLTRFADFLGEHDLDEFGAWMPFRVDDWVGGDNSLEFLLEQPFRVDAGLLHALPIGTTGSGDIWLVSLAASADRHPVFLYGHETGRLELVADSLQAFALANHIFERGGKSTAAEQKALSGRVRGAGDFELPGYTRKLASGAPALRLLEPTRDLRGLLNGYGRHRPEASRKLAAAPLPAEIVEALLRCFLRGDDDRLRELVERFERSPARFVRDAVKHSKRLLARRGGSTFEERAERLLGTEQRDDDDVLERAAACFAREDWDGVLEAYAKLPRTVRDETLAVVSNTAYALQRLDRHGPAVKAFRRATEIQPRNANLWAGLCFSLSSLERWRDMLPAAEQAARLDPKSSYAHQQVAVAYSGLEDWKRSVEAGRRAVALDRQNAYATLNLGVALLMLGDVEGRSVVEQACRLAPELEDYVDGDADVQRALAKLRARS